MLRTGSANLFSTTPPHQPLPADQLLTSLYAWWTVPLCCPQLPTTPPPPPPAAITLPPQPPVVFRLPSTPIPLSPRAPLLPSPWQPCTPHKEGAYQEAEPCNYPLSTRTARVLCAYSACTPLVLRMYSDVLDGRACSTALRLYSASYSASYSARTHNHDVRRAWAKANTSP